jgi:hypothetical protein
VFSLTLTALFLRPIYKVLREGGAAAQKSAGYKSMQKSKWMTLSGGGLAVLSSTALYTSAILCIVLGRLYVKSPFWINPCLNFMVFGVNLDSVLNDLGMLLASGVLKTMSCTATTKQFFTATDREVKVVPSPQPVFDSQAHEAGNSVANFERDLCSINPAAFANLEDLTPPKRKEGTMGFDANDLVQQVI